VYVFIDKLVNDGKMQAVRLIAPTGRGRRGGLDGQGVRTADHQVADRPSGQGEGGESTHMIYCK
jgi:hypothetical protein